MKLPIPQRGQPLDVSFISSIVSSINDLWDAIVVNASTYAALYTSEGVKNVRATETKTVTLQITPTGTNEIKKLTDVQTFSASFDSFLLPPIAVATVQSKDGATISQNAYATITEVTTNSINGTIHYGEKGSASVVVNVILVGVPI